MPFADVMELTVDSTFAGQNMSNVHHFAQTSGDGTGSWQTALTAIWVAQFQLNYSNLMTGFVQIVQIRMRRIEPTQTQQTTVPIGIPGNVADDTLPGHCAALLRQRATPSGRKGTGGVKIFGVPLGAVSVGRIDAAYFAAMSTYGNAMEVPQLDVASGYEFHSAVYSQVDNIARPILKTVPTTRVVTVHSRQIGVGT